MNFSGDLLLPSANQKEDIILTACFDVQTGKLHTTKVDGVFKIAISNKNTAFPLYDKPIVKYHFLKNEGQNALKILILIAQFFFYYYSHVS